jgi:Ni/Co efflux regulator RcnB
MMQSKYVLGALIVMIVAASPVRSDAQKTKPAPAMKEEAKARKAQGKDAKQDVKVAQKTEDRAEKAAKKEFKEQPERLMKGIKLSGTEKKQVKDIEKKYGDQFKALEKEEDRAEKAGQPMGDFTSRIATLRDQERSDLRSALTTAHQTRFDANAAKSGTKP